MRSGYLTSVPFEPGRRHTFPSLAVRVADATELAAHAPELDWARLGRVELGSLRDLQLTSPWRDRTAWRVAYDTEQVGPVLDLIDALRADGVELVLDIGDPALALKATFAASLGVRVRVALRAVQGDALVALNRLVTYYLLAPAPRRAMLEPFSTLERELRAGNGGGLWVASEESWTGHLYCDAQGRLAPSARFAEAGRFYGPVEELANYGWERTPQWKALEEYEEHLFLERAECAFCSAFGPCRGWLRALDPVFDCSVWRLVLESFEEAMSAPPPPSRAPGPTERRFRFSGATGRDSRTGSGSGSPSGSGSVPPSGSVSVPPSGSGSRSRSGSGSRSGSRSPSRSGARTRSRS